MLFPMARWTKKNFARVTDRSPDETMQWRLSRGSVRSHQVGVSRFTFTPGTRMPYGHRHREQEEVYVIVGGSGRMKIDDDRRRPEMGHHPRSPRGHAGLRSRSGRARRALCGRASAEGRGHRTRRSVLDLSATDGTATNPQASSASSHRPSTTSRRDLRQEHSAGRGADSRGLADDQGLAEPLSKRARRVVERHDVGVDGERVDGPRR